MKTNRPGSKYQHSNRGYHSIPSSYYPSDLSSYYYKNNGLPPIEGEILSDGTEPAIFVPKLLSNMNGILIAKQCWRDNFRSTRECFP